MFPSAGLHTKNRDHSTFCSCAYSFVFSSGFFFSSVSFHPRLFSLIIPYIQHKNACPPHTYYSGISDPIIAKCFQKHGKSIIKIPSAAKDLFAVSVVFFFLWPGFLSPALDPFNFILIALFLLQIVHCLVVFRLWKTMELHRYWTGPIQLSKGLYLKCLPFMPNVFLATVARLRIPMNVISV